jgi:hypothetical protein
VGSEEITDLQKCKSLHLEVEGQNFSFYGDKTSAQLSLSGSWKGLYDCQVLKDFPDTSQVLLHKDNNINLPLL